MIRTQLPENSERGYATLWWNTNPYKRYKLAAGQGGVDPIPRIGFREKGTVFKNCCRKAFYG